MKRIGIILWTLLGYLSCCAQPKNEVPFVGAEVFIEPGQTAQQIDHWFRLLKEYDMGYCRIRMFESYIHKPDGSWDYTLFDQAFRSAEKYHVKIFANVFPATSFADLGGIKFPSSDEQLASIAVYIKNLVTHFKSSPALYGWVLLNEPGTGGGIPNTVFTHRKMEEWKNRQRPPGQENGYMKLNFDKERFLLDYNTWFLNWLADEIHKYDPGSYLHVNNHQLFQNAAEYDFPAWRKFLSSLGASAHASWHFGYFKRQQYAVAMLANSEMIKSGAGNLPWLMTELQGGNNTYSGGQPMCPTPEEISQWLWLNVATGSKGSLFWCLNPRASGFESGEWAMIDFQGKPSERMRAASKVASVLKNNPTAFAEAVPSESGINIIYTRESLWIEKKMQLEGVFYDGRAVGGVMKSALGYFEALAEMGVAANLKEINEFDFTKDNYSGQAIILAQQISLPSPDWQKLENFVKKGGKLIVDGLSAYYDENAFNIMQNGFPLARLFGGELKEFHCVDNLFKISLSGTALALPAHLWSGTLMATTGDPVGYRNNEVIALRNSYGAGEVFWIPSLVGLGGRISGNYRPLSSFLYRELSEIISRNPFRFKMQKPGMIMKTLHARNSYITVIINKAGGPGVIQLAENKLHLAPHVLFNDRKGTVSGNLIHLPSEGTLVIQWEKDNPAKIVK
jgi:beta-galactosidase